MGSRISVVF
jgi:hypothetical protein